MNVYQSMAYRGEITSPRLDACRYPANSAPLASAIDYYRYFFALDSQESAWNRINNQISSKGSCHGRAITLLISAERNPEKTLPALVAELDTLHSAEVFHYQLLEILRGTAESALNREQENHIGALRVKAIQEIAAASLIPSNLAFIQRSVFLEPIATSLYSRFKEEWPKYAIIRLWHSNIAHTLFWMCDAARQRYSFYDSDNWGCISLHDRESLLIAFTSHLLLCYPLVILFGQIAVESFTGLEESLKAERIGQSRQ